MLRSHSPGGPAPPLLGAPLLLPRTGVNTGTGCSLQLSAPFSPLHRAADFLKPQPVTLPPPPTHSCRVFLEPSRPERKPQCAHSRAAAAQAVTEGHSRRVCGPLGPARPVSAACGAAAELRVSAQFRASAPPRLTQEAGGPDNPRPFGEHGNCCSRGLWALKAFYVRVLWQKPIQTVRDLRSLISDECRWVEILISMKGPYYLCVFHPSRRGRGEGSACPSAPRSPSHPGSFW